MANVVHPPGGPLAPEPPTNTTKKRKSRLGQRSIRQEKTATIQIRVGQPQLEEMQRAQKRERYQTFSEWARHHLIDASTRREIAEDLTQLNEARMRINMLLGHIDRNPGGLHIDYLKSSIERVHTDVSEVIDAMLRRVHP